MTSAAVSPIPDEETRDEGKPQWYQRFRVTLETQLEAGLTLEEASLLGKMLQHPTLVKALAIVYMPARQIPFNMVGLDLATQAEVVKMTRAQGYVQGIVAAVNGLADLALAGQDARQVAETQD